MRIVLIIFFVFTSVSLWAQKKDLSAADVQKAVVKFYEKFEKSKPTATSGIMIDCSMHIVPYYAEEGLQTKSRSSIILGQNFKVMKSELLDVYQDNTETFVLLKKQKTLMRAATPETEKSPDAEKALSMIPKNIVATAQTLSMRKESLNGKNVYRLELKVKEEFSKETAIEKLIFWYDPADGSIPVSESRYIRGFRNKSITIYLHSIDFSYRIRSTRAADYFMKNGKISSSYRTYNYIDNR